MGAARLQEKMAMRPCSAHLFPSFGQASARKNARLGPNLRNPERNSCLNADSAWVGLGLGLWSRIQVKVKEKMPPTRSEAVQCFPILAPFFFKAQDNA